MAKSAHLEGIFSINNARSTGKYSQAVLFLPHHLLGLPPGFDLMGHIACDFLRHLKIIDIIYFQKLIWGPSGKYRITYPEHIGIPNDPLKGRLASTVLPSELFP